MDKFNPEEPLFTFNYCTNNLPRMTIEQQCETIKNNFNSLGMQVLVVLTTNPSNMECIYQGKYGTMNKLFELIDDINSEIELSEDNKIALENLKQILTIYNRDSKIDDLLK